MSMIFVKPREGFKILDPHTFQVLPPEGENKVDDTYWRALERDKDVTISVEKPDPTPAPAPVPALAAKG